MSGGGEQPAEHSTLEKLSHKVTIPAMSEYIASIGQEDKIVEKVLRVHPIPSMAERCHLVVATSVDNANQATLNCRLINPSAEDITLPVGTSIALLSGFLEGIAIEEMESSQKAHINKQDRKINSISKEGEVMVWDQQGAEPDNDYGLDTLPCQEQTDKLKPMELQIDKEGLTEEQIQKLECFLDARKDLFVKHDRDLGDTNLITHKIDLGGANPVKARPNRINQSARAMLEKHVDTMLKHNVIEESPGSLWFPPVVLVLKPNQKDYRFCLVMRNVNKVTTIDSYPLPRIDDTLDALNGSKFFSSLDLTGWTRTPSN